MSSRILQPDDPRATAPLKWRRVGSPEVKPTAADPPKPDWRAQLAELEAQCEKRAREARAAGLREGESAGRDRAAAEMQPVVERLSRSIDELAALRPRLR